MQEHLLGNVSSYWPNFSILTKALVGCMTMWKTRKLSTQLVKKMVLSSHSSNFPMGKSVQSLRYHSTIGKLKWLKKFTMKMRIYATSSINPFQWKRFLFSNWINSYLHILKQNWFCCKSVLKMILFQKVSAYANEFSLSRGEKFSRNDCYKSLDYLLGQRETNREDIEEWVVTFGDGQMAKIKTKKYVCKNVAKVRSEWDPHDVSLDYGKWK